MINACVTRESYIECRENGFLVMPISRRVMAQIAYMTRHWKGRVIFYRLSHNLLESIKYRSSYTVSKIVKRGKQAKNVLSSTLNERIPNV